MGKLAALMATVLVWKFARLSGESRNAPLGRQSTLTPSLGFNSISSTQGFGRESVYVEPPVSCIFLTSILPGPVLIRISSSQYIQLYRLLRH